MRSDTTDWRQLNEFRDLDLESSFVLGWSLEGDTLLIDLDLLLIPSHPFFEEPRPAEKVCIRPAVLEFPHCDFVHDESGANAMQAQALKLATGAIHGLCVYDDGIYQLDGVFGRIVINSERPVLRMTQRE